VAATRTHVFDADCTLSTRIPIEEYCARVLSNDALLRDARHHRYCACLSAHTHAYSLLRCVRARDFRRTFTSTRRHMLSTSGEWQQPPPEWELINQPIIGTLMIAGACFTRATDDQVPSCTIEQHHPPMHSRPDGRRLYSLQEYLRIEPTTNTYAPLGGVREATCTVRTLVDTLRTLTHAL
jgi:hypothetical protein